jgi:hypothetical protein
MKDHDQILDSGGSREDAHHAIRELLPIYAMELALGGAPEITYADVAAHLASCAACRADLDELQELTSLAYTGQIEAAPYYPSVNLSFMHLPVAPLDSPQKSWLIDALGHLIVVFSDALLEALRQPTLAGATRGQLLYRYVQEPGSVQDLDVTIEAFVEDAASRFGRVRVGVDVPSRGPFDQAGSQVVLRAGETTWQDQTDEVGSVDFAPIPLEVLPQLRVEVIPLRYTAS